MTTQEAACRVQRKGFIDLQVNGYRGVDFCSPDLTFEDVRRITRALVDAGTVGYLATIVTSDESVYRHNLPLLARAMSDPFIGNHLLGIHLEGPFLSPEEGARGAHSPRFMKKPDRETFRAYQELAEGRISILTLAPELEGALELTTWIREHSGTRIAVGHHLAPRERLKQAVDAGATLITHLGNGCPNRLPRHDNVLVHQLAEDRLTAGIITDGNHLPEDFIRIVLRCKRPDGVFVVSDSVPIAGSEPGVYRTLGHEVRLTASGRVESLHAQHLVGSGCNMAQCMSYLRKLGILDEDELWKVGLENPLQILGMSSAPDSWAALPDKHMPGR